MDKEKRMAGAYEILYAIHIGDREIVLGENPATDAPNRYFSGWCDKGDLFERYIGDETSDYLKAMRIFTDGLSKQIEKVEAERAAVTVPMAPITAEQCYPDDLSENIDGKLVAVRADVLRSEYQTADRQLVLVTGGFGASANSRGSAVFCTNLYHGKHAMGEFAKQRHPESAFSGNYTTEYGFRVDTQEHTYLIRCNPVKGDYNFYCFCYQSKWLGRNLEKARQGIRFINSGYKELFRIPDGGKIIVTTAWGEKLERSCRYIDDTHMEVGRELYHICQFAEIMEKNGATYGPLPASPPPENQPKKKTDYER